MSPPERFLQAFQGTDGKKMVLEFESEHYLTGKWNAAKDLRLWVRRLTMEEFESEEFSDIQHFDMRHSATSSIFHLEQWLNYLMNEDGDPSS
ncbi:MAG: hypothetical protein IH802_05300 [Nitrospinae bacterium]|nr:hypothetical protein [Nitrospinota bacterium]